MELEVEMNRERLRRRFELSNNSTGSFRGLLPEKRQMSLKEKTARIFFVGL